MTSEIHRKHVFICHASEDKNEIARPLALELRRCGIDIWFDEFEIIWGDSVPEKINEGLSKSHIGIVIFGQTFLNKQWTNAELTTLLSYMIKQRVRLLPLLHNVDRDIVLERYSLLEGILFETSDKGVGYLKEQVKLNLQRLNSMKESDRTPIIMQTGIQTVVSTMDDKEISDLETNIISQLNEHVKSAALTELIIYSEKRSLWKNAGTWRILDFLFLSDKQDDIRDALMTVSNIIKLSRQVSEAEASKVQEKIEQFYRMEQVVDRHPKLV